jgi:hypothetical protein
MWMSVQGTGKRNDETTGKLVTSVVSSLLFDNSLVKESLTKSEVFAVGR